jgi:alpha/beta superfamily hydrolase
MREPNGRHLLTETLNEPARRINHQRWRAMPEVFFNGPEGRIEGRYFHNESRGAPIALVLHPHPLYGGTMNNKIAYHLFQAYMRAGFSVLRFNFRGVGKSQGKFDDGIGELADAATALDWLQQQNMDASHCWIAGFSFGAWIALQLLMRRPEIDGFTAISPPANLYDFTFLTPCPAAGLLTIGSKDDIALEEPLTRLAAKLTHQKGPQVEYKIINDADHYYRNHLDELNNLLDDYLDRRTNASAENRRIRPDRKRRQLPRD